jgi:hypothetical protein
MIINVFRSHVKYPLLLTDFNETAVQSTQDIQIQNFMKIRQVGVELFQAGGWT